MIDIKANMTKGLVVLTGEIIECCITFSNPANPTVRAQSNSDVIETLAWASAQIHCQCSVNESRVSLPKSTLPSQEVIATGVETSFVPGRGEKGHCALATKPKILFCDLRLLPGEFKTYIYRETISNDAPPSYRGQAVKYSYKLTIGTQRVNSPIKLLRVPLRVLVLHGLPDIVRFSDSDEMAPSNPFLQNRRKEENMQEVVLQQLQNITARRSPSKCAVSILPVDECMPSNNYYNITNHRGKVTRFYLFKSTYRLGEDIVGTFDFTESTVPCIQFSVTLQSEEIISEEYRRKPSQELSIMSFCKHHEVCLHIAKTHMILPIPLSVTPGFITDIGILKWKLHFEFVTSVESLTKISSPADPSESSTWHGPANVEVETMIWDLPIKIFPTNPIHAAMGNLVTSTTSMRL